MSDMSQSSDQIIATLTPSLARFWGALGIVVCFGALLLWISATGAAGSLIGSILFCLSAALSFYAAHVIYKIRAQSLILTHEGLFDNTGNTLCLFDEIDGLDRSFFALKPSNGFVIKLKTSKDRAWVPGLWWRFGKRVGVGGVTSVSQAKAMADTITLLLKGGSDLPDGLHNPFAR